MSTELRDALNHAICGELDAAFGRIAHCLTQLTDEQVWRRPPQGLNAIGNLVLHLTGNVKQMIADNLTGAPDTRDRPAEFAARGSFSGEQLLGKLLATVQRARVAFLEASDERLASVVRVNNND